MRTDNMGHPCFSNQSASSHCSRFGSDWYSSPQCIQAIIASGRTAWALCMSFRIVFCQCNWDVGCRCLDSISAVSVVEYGYVETFFPDEERIELFTFYSVPVSTCIGYGNDSICVMVRSNPVLPRSRQWLFAVRRTSNPASLIACRYSSGALKVG